MESSETSNVFIRRKKVPVNRHTWAGSERESQIVVVRISYMGYFWRVSSGQSSCFAWLWVHIWFILYGSPHPMHAHLLAKMDSSTEACGKVDTTYYGVVSPPFLAPEEPFCTSIVRRSPWPQEREICGLFIFYLARAHLLLAAAIIFILEYLSTGERLELLSLGPIYLLPQED